MAARTVSRQNNRNDLNSSENCLQRHKWPEKKNIIIITEKDSFLNLSSKPSASIVTKTGHRRKMSPKKVLFRGSSSKVWPFAAASKRMPLFRSYFHFFCRPFICVWMWKPTRNKPKPDLPCPKIACNGRSLYYIFLCTSSFFVVDCLERRKFKPGDNDVRAKLLGSRRVIKPCHKIKIIFKVFIYFYFPH